MITITRKIEFDAGHRVLRHESKCAHLHGHRYVAEITVTAPELDSLGRVIDFGCLKKIIGEWVDTNWDHNILLNSEDPLLHVWDSMGIKSGDVKGSFARNQIFAGKEPYVFHEQNPTAEVIAAALLKICRELLPAPLSVTNVRIYETPNCWADASE